MSDSNELVKKLSLAEDVPDSEIYMNEEERDLARIVKHREWLKSIRHEVPSPAKPFNVGVYILSKDNPYFLAMIVSIVT